MTLFNAIDGFDVDAGLLTVFVSVVFVNSPTVFRIVRGLAVMDIKTRDYVAAAQTRGEGMVHHALGNSAKRACPLIVDFCLRIGYTTILLEPWVSISLDQKARTGVQRLTKGANCSIYPHLPYHRRLPAEPCAWIELAG